MFELFYYSHKILFIFIIITICMHSVITLFYLIPVIILYLIDIFIRIKNTKKTILLDSKIISSNKETRYIIFKLRVMYNSHLYPGTYFFINLKDMSRMEWHPLSYVQNSKNCITFFVKDMGKNSWTRKIKNKKDILENIIIQGPYGNLYNPKLLKKYKHIIFFAGGIGITPLISIIQDIDLKLKNGLYKNIENISIFWSISKLILIECYQDLFQEFNKNKISLKIYCNESDLENKFDYTYNIKFKK
jgi:predicted ferric reductase